MARPDIGRYFDKLVARGRGGRRRRAGAPAAPGERGDRSSTGSSAPRRTTTAKVTIEYTPSIDGDPDPGEVVWTWVPFEEDPTQGKDRPVVVIGRRGNRLVGIPLTTRADDREVQVRVGSGAWDPDRRMSYARIWRLLEIDEHKMRREGAILERDRFDAIIDAVDDYYDVVAVQPDPPGPSSRGVDDHY
jgi:hypothetical protein